MVTSWIWSDPLVSDDDGGLLPFYLRERPVGLQDRFEIGTRVKFIKRASTPIARGVELVPMSRTVLVSITRRTAQGHSKSLARWVSP